MTLLERLSDAWARRYHSRASGGSWALSGFAYQFHVSIVEILHAFLRSADKDVVVSFERLGDVATSVDDSVLIVQVKRRLGRGALREALDQYRTILEVAREEFPGAVPSIRFVVTSAEASGDLEAERTSWLESLDVAPDERSRISRSIELRREQSPLHTALSLLHNELKARDALRLVERWVGELTRDPQHGALRVWSDLVELRRDSREVRVAGVILTEVDRAPDETRRGYVLIGQPPHVHNLRDGAFAPRAGLVSDLTDRLLEWAGEEQDGQPVTSLRVFWITGRSGSGKSVAMMQTAAEARERWPGPIVWLGSAVHLLPDAVSWASAIQRESGERVLLVVDDPYVLAGASEIWRAATDRVRADIETGDADALPFVLACGPAEQSRRLQEDLRSLVSVHEVPLPGAGSDDWAELRRFFRERTNDEPPPDDDSRNMLLVQAFFEWREQQKLPDFAESFAARVERLDQTGATKRYVSLLLAANRIYVGLPGPVTAALLGPAELDALADLSRDHHLVDEEEDRPGRWFAHAHLSTAIYNGWFSPGTTTHQRIAHLVDLWQLERDHCGAPARSMVLDALARLGRSNPADRDERVPPAEMRGALADLWARERSEPATLVRSLPTWIELAAVLDLELDPHPRDLALDELPRVGRDMTVTDDPLVVALTRYAAVRPDSAGRRASDALERHLLSSGQRDEAWAAALRDLAQHHLTPALAAAGLAWAAENPGSVQATDVLAMAARVGELRPACMELFTERAKPTKGWARLGAQLARTEETREQITAQLKAQLVHWRSGHLLAALLDARQLRDPGLLRGWVRMHGSSPLAGAVLEAATRAGYGGDTVVAAAVLREVAIGTSRSGALLAAVLEQAGEAQIAEIRRRALAGLRRMDTPHWAELWDVAWRRSGPDDREELRRLVDDRLGRHAPLTHRARWWCVAFDRLDAVAELQPAGEALLRDAIGTPSFSYLFERLWREGAGSQELITAGMRHLRAPEAHGWSWFSVWSALFEYARASGEDGLLRTCTDEGRRVLEYSPAAAGYGELWARLNADAPSDESLLALGRRALEACASPQLARIWTALWSLDPGSSELRRVGLELVRRSPFHNAVGFVVTALLAHDRSDEVVQVATDVVAHHPENDSVVHILTALSQPGGLPTKRLIPLGVSFLRARPDHRGVGHLWALLKERAAADPRVDEVGSWLVRAHPAAEIGAILRTLEPSLPPDEYQRYVDAALEHTGTAAFEHLWPTEWQKRAGDGDLVASGRRYVTSALEDGRPGFGYVWPRLWRYAPDDDLLRAGLDFVERHAGHPGFGYVFEALWESRDNRDALFPVAWHFLRTQPGHKAYGRVWLAVWTGEVGAEELHELATLGFRHVAAHVTAESFPWVWTRLWSSRLVPREVLLRPAFAYLNRRPFPEGFSTVFERVWGVLEQRPTLRQLGRSFVHASRSEATSTLHLLMRDDPSDETLTERALEVVRRGQHRARDFGQVWQLVHDRRRSSAGAKDAIVRGATVLVERPWDVAAPMAWAYLMEVQGPSERLDVAARRMLKHHGSTMPTRARASFAAAGYVVPAAPTVAWHSFLCPSCWDDTGCHGPETGRFTRICVCTSCGATLRARRAHGGYVSAEVEDESAGRTAVD